ncbi:hypothetical protein F5Y09DRAFT_264581 [Xylaria sp. FL1042]|nr:hypothetical protein F5Y09DRAFT_264581 [Xylaria sp. FL1042]
MATKKSAVRGALTPNIPVAEANPEDEVATTPYAQALSRLSPLGPVLAGFAHRNHNQHRRAPWWRHFGLLRRNWARLIDDLISAIAAARKSAAKAAKAAKAQGKKRRREELVAGDMGTAKGKKDEDVASQDVGVAMKTDENVTTYATWVRDVLVPKCYLAFSQLTADPQFAPLGVVLLGVLAQIQAACDIAAPRLAPILPSPSARDIPAITESRPSNIENVTMATPTVVGNTAVLLVPELGPKTNERATAPGGKKDDRTERSGGKAISRADVERATAQHKRGKGNVKAKTERDSPRTTPSDRAKSSAPPEASAVTAARPSSKRQGSSRASEEIPRPAKKTKTVAAPREGEKSANDDKDKKKKKKKAKKGDEFDDLFKGLF